MNRIVIIICIGMCLCNVKIEKNAIIWTLMTCDKPNVSVLGRFTFIQANEVYLWIQPIS